MRIYNGVEIVIRESASGARVTSPSLCVVMYWATRSRVPRTLPQRNLVSFNSPLLALRSRLYYVGNH